MIQFFMLKLHLGGGCMSPTPKFELRISEEGRVYKIWDLMYKIVQNYDPVFHVETAFEWGCMSPAPQIWIADAQEGIVYRIFDSVYKIVQNKFKIMIYFSFSKSVLGGPVTCTYFTYSSLFGRIHDLKFVIFV